MLLGLATAAYFIGLGDAPIERAEIYFLDAARGMVERSDLLVPYYRGLPFYDTPALTYWLLALSFDLARMGGILLLWIGLAFILTRSSRAQDRDAALRHTRRTVALSAIGLLLIGISGSVAAFDWLMSLETHWYSTMYRLYSLSGVLVAGVSAITIGVVLLSRRGRLPGVADNHIHDLGKLMFGFSTLWAYLWLSQWLLIWYANLPEETTYYLARTSGGWGFLFWSTWCSTGACRSCC